MAQPYLIACGVLLLASLLARTLPVARRSFDDDYEDGWDLDPRALAYLRSGPYGVVLTVLAQLHAEGAVDASGSGAVRRLDPPGDCDDRLAIAVYSGLSWARRPRLVALLPRVRRACAPLRQELLDRALVPPPRRRIFSAALRLYAAGLAIAPVFETGPRGTTVVAALAVCAVAAICGLGPRRTVAGWRELATHRAALRRVATDAPGEAAWIADVVAAHGLAGLRVLCGSYVPCGALAPPAPSYEPPPVPVRLPRPVAPARVDEPVRVDAPVRLPVPAASVIVLHPRWDRERDRERVAA